jgi:hypothetical protein
MPKKITLEVVLERLDNLIKDNKEDHTTIIIQTTKTNGRVTKLEAWKNVIVGGLIILNVIVWPVILLFITKVL